MDKVEQFFAQNGIKKTDKRYQVYQNLLKLNSNVSATINLDMLDKSIFDIFEINKLARITTYPKVQEMLVKAHSIQGMDSVLDSISHDSQDWVIELDNMLKNMDKYDGILQDMPKQEIDEHTSLMLRQVFAQKENYFNISSVSEARNYFDIRNDTCRKILSGEKVDNLNPVISQYSEEDKKRFAILELMYGIDISEAKNLIEKYGKDIDKIDSDKHKDLLIVLRGIRSILECKDINEKSEAVLSEKLETIECKNIAELEASCLNMYADLYQETLYQPKEEDKVDIVAEYEGEKIDVYEVKGDFNMFIRIDGATTGKYREPENFDEKLSKPKTDKHGNCKSYIGNDSLSMATGYGGVKYGYSRCEQGSLILSAPWDIMSNAAISDFSTPAAKWDFICGVQFRIPQEMKNQTRHGYNEFDSERLMYDEETGKFRNDKPQYIIYVEEEGYDRESDEQWRLSKKAAKQLGIPIVILNREKIVEKEYQKHEDLLEIFEGKKENVDNIPEAELLEKIIVNFENNANGMNNMRALGDYYRKIEDNNEEYDQKKAEEIQKYFTMTQRNQMIKRVWNRIKAIGDSDPENSNPETSNPEKKVELMDKLVAILENEHNKGISNSGKKVAPGIATMYNEKFINHIKGLRDKHREELPNAKNKEGLSAKRNALLEAKKRILGEKYERKSGINMSLSLEDCLEQLEENGLMEELLKSDENIKQDTEQYDSPIHGSTHTRRVNFLATMIMSMEGMDQETIKLIRTAAINHDIGRVNDQTDDDHGIGSVEKLDAHPERLDGLTDEQKKLVKFIIREHSISGKENKEHIAKLPEEIQEQYRQLLALFKDADKLDRVRLDRSGFESYGLDAKRLSFESSKKLENVAYEGVEKLLRILDIEKEIRQVDEQLSKIAASEEKHNVATLLEKFYRNITYKDVNDAGEFLVGEISRGKNEIEPRETGPEK